MADDRLTHLREVGRLLWPAPLELAIGPASGAAPGTRVHREFLLLPTARRPRLIVPRGRRAAAGALRGYGVGRGRAARWQAAGLAAGMLTGIAPLVLRDRVRLLAGADDAEARAATIESHLAEVLGTEVLVSMYLGAPRANRKPVLQVLTPDGRTLAYVKVGVDPLTSRLVRAEAAALTTLAAAGLRRLTAPRVLHTGEWRGLTLLVQSPLPVGSRTGRPGWSRVAAAQSEVAAIGSSPAVPLAGSPYWTALTERIAGLPATGAAEELAALAERATSAFGDVPLRFGAWHGDWTPWNTAAGDDLLVWDWERFAPSVPVGYDALHWGLQMDLVNRLADPSESAVRSLVSAPSRLEAFGVSAREARATAVGYLAELSTRYLADRQVEAGARLGNVGAWLLPAMDRALAGR
jgi:hypothetical protein